MTAHDGRALGVLGGTFDPVHFGHLAVAEEAREALDLDSVIFVPAGSPPHKQEAAITPARHREAMVRLAIEGNGAFSISRIELERPGPSYAVETLASIAAGSAAEGRPEPVFIMSAETLAGLITWREPMRLLDLCRIAIAPRPGATLPGAEWLAQRFPGRQGRFTALPGPRLGHASSDIRARVRQGRSIRYLVPDTVAGYITKHGLYLGPG